MINGHDHAEPVPLAVNDVPAATAAFIRVLTVVLLITAIPLQVALWRWAL
ncbi:hypothetical protein NE236_41470 [Actinoallomurus purpureus]|nr:hypothetical protein [Actinoallomurus purpureus]MCO6011439.1 hypothetical protein [Actinoallomurus purpureus]